jgi:uncharacterized membrane protein YkvA (DUF1232 family)
MEIQKTYTSKKGMSAKDWIITILGGAYMISPLDIIPDTIPVAGWIDDILVGIGTISNVLDSQLSQTNRTLSSLLKAVKWISFSLWGILGFLILIFGALVYQLFTN